MAYRRRQGITRLSTFKEDIYHQDPQPNDDDHTNSSSSSSFSTSSSLAVQAIRASAAHRESSLSSIYGSSSFPSFGDRAKDSIASDYASTRSTNEPGGFWGVLARKAKSILEDDNVSEQFDQPCRKNPEMLISSTGDQFFQSFQNYENSRKLDNPRLQKRLDALTSSLNQIGNSIGNALEEGRTIVENKTADIIQETRRLQIRKKGIKNEEQNQGTGVYNSWQSPSMQSAQQIQTNQETQLKASRDVAMATAAKAKLLLRELKTVKADLAFAKQRCSQLEEENRILREAREKGVNPADDDMIRLQLETLLAEKARLAHENSVYARENRFLREVVEYHQLTMQDVVYLDECIEEVTEVYPIPAICRTLSASLPSSSSPRSTPLSRRSSLRKALSVPLPPQTVKDVLKDVPQSEAEAPLGSDSPVPSADGLGRSKNSAS